METKRAFLNFPSYPIVLFFLFFALLLTVKANILNVPYHWDVMGYVMPSADAFFETGRLSSLTGLSGHPPLFFIVLVLVWTIFGQSVVVSHVLILVFGALSLSFLFVLTEKLYGWKEAVAAVLLLFFNQLFFAQVGTAYLSVPLMCLAILTVHLYLRQKHLLYLISASAMLLIKETAAVILLAVVLFDLIHNISQRVNLKAVIKKCLLLSLPLASLVLWFFYHGLKAGWTVNMKLLVNKHQMWPLFQYNILRYLFFDWSGENVNRANWIIFFAVTIFIVAQAVKKKSLKTEWLFLMIIFLNILFFSYSDDLPRYFLIIYPFYFILGARAFVVLSEKAKLKNLVLLLLLLSVISLSVFNYEGRRDVDGWRLESNMEYLDLVRVCQSAAHFIESEYPEYKIITTFPLDFAFENPRYGYVSKPLSLISAELFESYDDVLVVRSFQANYLYFNRFMESKRSRLRKIVEFSQNGKLVVIFKKRNMENLSIRKEENSKPG